MLFKNLASKTKPTLAFYFHAIYKLLSDTFPEINRMHKVCQLYTCPFGAVGEYNYCSCKTRQK